MTLVEEWTASQRDQPDRFHARNPTLDTTSTRWDTILVFRDLLLSTIDPLTAAQCIAELVLSHPNIMEAYDYMSGCFFEAVEFFPSTKVSSLLSDFEASLAGLPDAINQRNDPMIIKSSKSTTIQPGDPIIVHWTGREQHIWRDLPHFSLYLREKRKGPEAYLDRGDSPETAASVWKNINTFVAILFRDHGNEFPELFGSLAIYTFTTLADALEHPPGSRFGRNMPLHLPAACQWILLAGTEVCDAIEEGYNGDYWTARAGQLWTREGGSDELNEERWLFWKHRFGELTADARLDAAMDWEAALAELSMCDLQIRNNSQGGLP